MKSERKPMNMTLLLQDPVQDKFPEESLHGALRRTRVVGQGTARPASRSSYAGTRVRGHRASPAYDAFNSPSPSQVIRGPSILGRAFAMGAGSESH